MMILLIPSKVPKSLRFAETKHKVFNALRYLFYTSKEGIQVTDSTLNDSF